MIPSQPTCRFSTALGRFTTIAAAAVLVACGGGSEVEDSRRAPLAVTTTASGATYDRDDLYRFFTIAFGAAPGVTYMGQLLEAANAGMSIKSIVNVFTTKTQFTDVYPTTLTNQEFARKLVDNVVGSSATAASKDVAVNDIVAALSLPSWTRGDIIFTIFTNLANKPANDPDWAGTSKKLANQVLYAKYFTETMAVDTVDLPKLRAVVGAVTETSTATGDLSVAINTAISQISNTAARTTVVRAHTAEAPAYDTASGKALPGNYVTGRYSASAGEAWWWGGNYPEQIQSGYGFNKTNAAQWGFGIYIANGGAGWDIANATRYGFTLGSNGECANACTVTVRLVSKVDAACVADYRVKLTSADITTAYTVNLADFTVKGCATNTVSAFKAGKVAELHFQMLRDDMQFVAGTDGNGNYANGLGIGGNVFFE